MSTRFRTVGSGSGSARSARSPGYGGEPLVATATAVGERARMSPNRWRNA